MKLPYDNLPLPSIFCLIAICFIPYIARETHSLWRAVQAYDSQTRITVGDEAPLKAKRRRRDGIAAFLAFLLLLLALLAFMYTSGGTWQEEYPTLAAMRNTLPEAAFLAFVPLAFMSALAYLLHPWPTAISRKGMADRAKDYIKTKLLVKTNKTRAQLFRVRFYFAMIVIGFVWLVQRTGMKYTIPLAATAGLIFLLQACHLPIILNDAITFRAMCLIGVVVLAASLVAVAVIFAIVFAILTFYPGDSVDDPTAGPSDSMGFMQIPYDLAFNQISSLNYPFLWSFSIFFHSVLVGLAYRYDMTQAGLSILSQEEKEQIVAASDQPTDKLGCSPILLHTAAVPKSVLATVPTPMYKTAFYTLLITQIIGVLIEYSLGWTGYTKMPTSTRELPLERNDLFSAWPLLAYPLMLAAMLIRAKMQSHQSFVNLWTYREDWSRSEDKVKVEQDQEAPTPSNKQSIA